MAKNKISELKVGLFVVMGIGLTLFAIMSLGGSSLFFNSSAHYKIQMGSTDGLIPGAKVILGGIQAGKVKKIDFEEESTKLSVDIEIDKKYEPWINESSVAEVKSLGMLGDKIIYIQTKDFSAPMIPRGGKIAYQDGADLKTFISKGDQLLESITQISSSLNRILSKFENSNRSEKFFEGAAETAKNLSETTKLMHQNLSKMDLPKVTKHLETILEKIDSGQGSLGAMINDPTLYDDIKSLVGGVNRNRIMRNLVRKTIQEQEEALEAEKLKRNPSNQ